MKIPYLTIEYCDAALLREAAEFYAANCPEDKLTPYNEAKLLLTATALHDMALEYDELEVTGLRNPKDEPTPACAE